MKEKENIMLKEVKAIKRIYSVLAEFNPMEANRVLRYVIDIKTSEEIKNDAPRV